VHLHYVSASTLPSAEANAVHVAQMCDAFAGLDCEVTLHALPGGPGDVRAQYGLRHRFAIRLDGKLGHRLWLLARRLRLGGARDTLYFGRRLPSLTRLARSGLPTGFELHHPPRTPAQERRLRDLVAAPRFLGLVVISERLRDEALRRLPGLDPARVLVAADGVRADLVRTPRLRAGDGPVRAVYCGSFHAGKGADTVLAAAARVPEVAFDLIGGSPEQVAHARSLASANVTLLGHLPHDETQRRLAGYDLALAPYAAVVRGAQTPEHESLADWMSPLKIFEYMAAGLPIVTSDLPVLREILEPGRDACMTPPGDAQALADAVRALAQDPQQRLRLAQSAHERLGSHTWDNRAARILEFLQSGMR
jgi:glycosyltransferase involved in cell wall biosynthesis